VITHAQHCQIRRAWLQKGCSEKKTNGKTRAGTQKKPRETGRSILWGLATKKVGKIHPPNVRSGINKGRQGEKRIWLDLTNEGGGKASAGNVSERAYLLLLGTHLLGGNQTLRDKS